MLAARLLPAGGGSAFAPATITDLVGLINGTPDTNFVYAIGPVTSDDGGATATVGAAATLTKGAGGTWDQTYVKDPAVVWDGTQFVVLYAGWNGTGFRIGRATAATIDGTMTKYASNPVIGFGGAGAADEDGAEFPVVLYEAGDSPPWKMWYAAYPNGATPGDPSGLTVCYADSNDGLTWTKRGTVVPLGAAASFYDDGVYPGAVIRVGLTYYLFVTGFRSNLLASSGYVTTTNPAVAASYSTATELTGYGGNISAGGVTWQSNLIRSVIDLRDGTYRFLGTLWNPTPTDTEEVSFSVTGSSLTAPPVPSALWFSLTGWYANSGENPSLIPTP